MFWINRISLQMLRKRPNFSNFFARISQDCKNMELHFCKKINKFLHCRTVQAELPNSDFCKWFDQHLYDHELKRAWFDYFASKVLLPNAVEILRDFGAVFQHYKSMSKILITRQIFAFVDRCRTWAPKFGGSAFRKLHLLLPVGDFWSKHGAWSHSLED